LATLALALAALADDAAAVAEDEAFAALVFAALA
jgi:hypothetical protein